MQILKSLFFTEVSPLVKKAKTKIIDESDLLPLPADIDPRVVSIKVEKVNWRSPVALLFSMVPALRKYMLPAYSWYGASAMFSLLSPVLIHRFVSYVSAGVTQETLPETLVVGILLGFCGFLSGFCIQHYFKYCLRANQVMTNFFNEK
ncbi:MAG TPA: hypothetical protein VN132_04355, partial [Bdellovibrio sp.]|nr:hypothetical protein [Bdellovibrio sp.]